MDGDDSESAVERYRRRRAEQLAGPTRYLDPAPELEHDTLWRGLTREGELRLLVARTTATARVAVARLGCNAETGRLVAELLTAALLVRSTLNPEAQLQLSVSNQGSGGRLIADVWAGEAGMRASIAHPQARSERDGPLVGEGVLHVARSRSREPYRSSTALLPQGIDATMMEYLLRSEQILSHLHVNVAVVDGVIAESSGCLVQVMPEGSRADLERLVRNLENAPPLRGAMVDRDPDARAFAGRLLAGFRWDQCARERVSFACRCSRGRVLAALAALPEEEIAAMVAEGKPAETICEFCGEIYRIADSELRGLLSPPH